MKVETIKKGMWCDPCDEGFVDEAAFRAHQESEHMTMPQELFRCGECEQIYLDKDEAKECCK